MPQVKDNIEDGWYQNLAKNSAGEPRPWGAATVSFKPGAVRFVPAALRKESRSVNDAFVAGLANGSLVGPAPAASGPWEGQGNAPKAPAPPVEEPKAEEPVVEEAAEEPVVEEAAPAEEPAPELEETSESDETEDTATGTEKKKRRRRSNK